MKRNLDFSPEFWSNKREMKISAWNYTICLKLNLLFKLILLSRRQWNNKDMSIYFILWFYSYCNWQWAQLATPYRDWCIAIDVSHSQNVFTDKIEQPEPARYFLRWPNVLDKKTKIYFRFPDSIFLNWLSISTNFFFLFSNTCISISILWPKVWKSVLQ